MEKEQRNLLRNAVVKARRLLEAEYAGQLEGLYNILPSGEILDGGPGDPIARRRLLELIAHHRAGGASAEDAVERVTRELAFTTLNRFAALKMAERRGLVRECVSQGLQSAGIRELADCAPGLKGAYEDGGYRLLLEAVMDEISLDLQVLFDRRSPIGLLWPRPPALEELLEILNASNLADLWEADETIGWIYQYFNADDVKKMRDESAAPRNSRELAVRNQFFTPRYVVEFLTDNTLGRLWYEMRHGETALRERCRYLVRRPTEIFLKPGEGPPSEASAKEGLSQEELLRQPVHIPHRSLKDPREIRLLDPACGSMHFGLYAFDLFTLIYDEAWEIAHGLGDAARSAEAFAPFVAFTATFPDKAAFLREVPRLIVEHNIHGIEIDPRAAQIAGLSLWLRSLRAWHEAGVKTAERPRITRSNLVCAEPMPGEKELLREFVERQLPAGERPAFGFLLEKIFDRMILAGEAGSLLRIEEEIRTDIADAKRLWRQDPRHEQASLFPELGKKGGQGELPLDLSGITDERFWERVEQRLYDALEAYAKQAESGGRFQRRLFADDAAQGFAFIDLCRKRYDVVVMNPPFGASSKQSKGYVSEQYAASANDVFAAFIERGLLLGVSCARLGAITSRTGLFLETFLAWRETSLFGDNSTAAVLDLGYGVLDAMVETAAYVIQKGRAPNSSVCIRGVKFVQKDAESLAAIAALAQGDVHADLFVINQAAFADLPLCSLPYWLPEELLALYCEKHSFLEQGGSAKKGLTTGDNFRFVRATWEVSPSEFALSRAATFQNRRWAFFPKGGEYSPFYDDIHLVVAWCNDGKELKSFRDRSGTPLAYPRSEHLYFKCGLTYPYRTTSGFNLRPLPAGCVFSDGGQAVFFEDKSKKAESPRERLLTVLGYFNSRYARLFMEVALGEGDAVTSGSAARNYVTAAIESVPMFGGGVDVRAIARLVEECVGLQMRNFSLDETSRTFCIPRLCQFSGLHEVAVILKRSVLERCFTILKLGSLIEQEFAKDLALSVTAETFLDAECGRLPTKYPVREVGDRSAADLCALDTEMLVDKALRVVGPGRYVVKKMYLSDRRLELISHILNTHPCVIFDSVAEIVAGEAGDYSALLLGILVGVAFGRWDIRYATGERPEPELPDPFAPLPVCPPGMLQGDNGLPLSSEAGRRLRSEGRYPLDVAWDGVFVDDREHSLDLESRVRTALGALWGDRADAVEREACTLLGVQTLREWFRRPAGFFADHLKHYSKSRRKAPIYWPLSTPSGSYTAWVYYPRLSHDTLYRILTDLIEPKLARVDGEIVQLERERSATDGRHGAKLSKQISDLVEPQAELRAMRDELRRVAELPYRPDLNDGVQITAAPLWRLFQHKPWRKVLEQTWKELQAGKYDWAHLAYAIWPERVRAKCRIDKSMAIAHDLEELYEERPLPEKARRGRKKTSARASSTLPDLLPEAEGD